MFLVLHTPSHWNQHTIDSYAKDASIVNLTSDELTQACLSDLTDVDFDSKEDMETFIRRTKLVLDLISSNNQRVSHLLSAVLVSNKKHCRESVLERFNG